ncbi:hypothetical protein Tco_0532493 [Tanacetum coccineum]
MKLLEAALKRKSMKVIFSESKDEETEDQERKIQDIDEDPLVSLVKKSMEEKEADFVTPKKVSASGEAQEEDISPTTLEAAKTLSKVASQNVSTYKRRARSVSMDFFSAAKERLNSAKVEVNTEVNPGSAGVNTGNTPVSTPSVIQTVNVIVPSPVKSQREGKAPMTSEDKRKVEVQEATQFYTEEDWDTIRAKLEANVELTKSLQGENVSSDDFANRMVDMINQKKKYYAEQKAKVKRDKPMTQAQQRDYMSTFIKNQSSWKMDQLKKLTFEELKVEFEKLMRSIESFMPMRSEERVKSAGVQLEQESSKKQKIVVEDVLVTEEKVEDHEAEEDMEALVKGNDIDSSLGIDISVSVVLVAIKPPSIANWKIIKLGNKGVYQIIREDGTYITYINFGAMLKSISRDDLTELYRLIMQKYGTNRPEDKYERVFWGDLKTMFDPPLTDIYMLTERRYLIPADMCQAMLDKKLQGDKKDEACYQLIFTSCASLQSSQLKFSSRPGKGTVSDNMLLRCVPDTLYGPHLIRRILEKSALAFEIDLSWSRGFISIELGRLPNPLSCKTLLICPICISKVLIEAPWFLIAASVEARISLIMFEFSSCLLAYFIMNLVSDSSRLGLRSGYEEFPLFYW